MSKAVLISIRPKWCELIASGKKTIEVRKTAPKIKTPFKGYIYCTKDPGNKGSATHFFESDEGTFWSAGKTFAAFLSGTVIGEFVCDRIESTNCFSGWVCPEKNNIIKRFLDGSCLSEREIVNYADGRAVCGWHISDLVIYDEPRFLTQMTTEKMGRGVYIRGPVTRPPQSYCYVEELE